MRTSRLTLALAIATLLLGATLSLAQNAPSLQQADTLGEDLFLKSGSTGMVLVVVRNQEVYVRGFGETAVGNGQKPDANSLLRLCSITKIFASDLLMKQVQARLVTLDTPLQRLAPSHLKVPSLGGRAITLKHLATHTSGLPREVGHAPRGTPHLTFPDFDYRWRWLPKQRLKTVPGSAALYSNIGFDLLGDAIQSVGRKPYAQLLAERTTVPLGMTETTFTPTPGQCARLLQGAHDEGPCTDTQASAGSSGLYSTAADMTLWLRYLLGTGTPMQPAQSPAAQAVYVAPSSLLRETGLDHAGTPSGIGLGWLHLLDDANPSAITEKTGGGAGFLTYIALNQHTHTGIFLAATDGMIETHLNVFKEANNLLLTLAGVPPLPPEPPKPVRPRTHKKTRKRTHP